MPIELADRAGTISWTFSTGDAIHSSPAIGLDGTIYVGSDDGHLYAVHPDGTEKWKYDAGSPVGAIPAVGTDGTVYFINDNRLLALDPGAGTEKWIHSFEEPVYSASPALAADGSVYVGAHDGLHAIDRFGEEKWVFQNGSINFESPSVGPDGTIYVGTDLIFWAINPDGTEKWKNTDALGNEARHAPTIDANTVLYVINVYQDLSALNSDGTKKWITSAHPYPPSIGTDGTLYVAKMDWEDGEQSVLAALDPEDGSTKWMKTLEGLVSTRPALGDDGLIYVGTSSGTFYALDEDGNIEWDLSVGSGISSSPTIGSDGTIYFGNDDGKLYAVVSNSYGLADSAWPKIRQNNFNRGSREYATNWEEAQQLYPVDASVSGDGFGASVFTDGRYALVGMPGDDTWATGGGAVYLYRRNAMGERIFWSPEKVLYPPGTNEKTLFGHALGNNQGQFLVGAPNAEVASERRGAVYLYWRARNQWQEATLSASDGQAGDQFGYAIATSGTYLLVSAPSRTVAGKRNAGAVYVFERGSDGRRWKEVGAITAAEPKENEQFGYALALEKQRALIGASDLIFPCRTTSCPSAGAVYLFENEAEPRQWTQLKKLTSNRPNQKDNYGRALAFNGEDIMVGASTYRTFWPGSQNQGAVFLYSFSKLTADSGQPGADMAVSPQPPKWKGSRSDAYFGSALSMRDRKATIGEPGTATVHLLLKDQSSLPGRWRTWQEFSGPAGSSYGEAVTIADRNLIAASSSADDYGLEETGYVGVIEEIPGSDHEWTLYGKLPPYNANAKARGFGYAFVSDGDGIVVPFEEADASGQYVPVTYLFEKRGYGDWWEQAFTLRHSDEPTTRFTTGAISGDYAIGGDPGNKICPLDNSPTDNRIGRAFAYYRNAQGGEPWMLYKTLVPHIENCQTEQPQFGSGIGLSEQYLAIGAMSETEDDPEAYRGAVYFYRAEDSSFPVHWELMGKVFANECDRYLGSRVAIDRDLVAVGRITRGCPDQVPKAYVFDLSQDDFQTPAYLFPGDYYGSGFGSSLDVDWESRKIAAAIETENTEDEGVYIFQETAEAWALEQKLERPLPEVVGFGNGLSLTENHLLTGAPQSFYDPQGRNTSGAAFIFRYDTATERWLQEWAQTEAPDRVRSFGSSVYLDSTQAMIGGRGGVFIYHNWNPEPTKNLPKTNT